MNLNTGQMLHDYFEAKRIRRAALARLLDINLPSLMAYEKKESIHTHRLLEISKHLQHNFFMDIAQQLPADYTTAEDLFAEKNQHIAQLEEELKMVKAERDILLKLLKPTDKGVEH